MNEASLTVEAPARALREALRTSVEPAGVPEANPRWREDLAFFASVYLAGLVFFLLVIA